MKDFKRFVDLELIKFQVAVDPECAGLKATRGKKVGARFENFVQLANRRYENLRLGIVTKQNVSVGISRLGRKFYRSKQTVDYIGWLKDVGFVAFDAKSTTETYFHVDPKQIHQFCYLLSSQRHATPDNARFFYLVEASSLREPNCFVVEDLEQIYQTGRYEFAEADLIRASKVGATVDYRQKLIETFSLTEAPHHEISCEV